MSILTCARTAIAAALLTALPLQAVAAAPAALPVMAGTLAVQDESGDGDDRHPFLSNYLVPTLIVVALGLGLYFGLADEGDQGGPTPVSP